MGDSIELLHLWRGRPTAFWASSGYLQSTGEHPVEGALHRGVLELWRPSSVSWARHQGIAALLKGCVGVTVCQVRRG